MQRRVTNHPIPGLLLVGLLALGGCGGDTTGTQATDTATGDPDVLTGTTDTPQTPVPDATTPTPDVVVPAPDTTGPDPVPDTTEPEPIPDTTEPEPEEDTWVDDDVWDRAYYCDDGVCDPWEGCEVCPTDCPACWPAPGDLVITEIMQNPKLVDDSVGEWFEVRNVSSEDVELSGLILRDDGQDEHEITPWENFIIAPGDYAILASSDDLGAGLVSDYTYSNFSLSNGDDQVVLELDGIIIDAVTYDGGTNFPDPKGASMNLSPDAMTASANDDGANWCVSQTAFGAGDFGTPGAANEECPICGDGTCDDSETCDSCASDCGDTPACASCGDDTCDDTETCESCPNDCGCCNPCTLNGASPTTEVCNGIDDDCDCVVDNDVACDDGIACTDDVCDGASGCSSETDDSACYIGGTCYSDGDANPNDACEQCYASASANSWSTAGGKCLIDGACLSDGDANPNNTCQECDSSTTSTGWSSTLFSLDCDDGDPCTENEKCVAGFCILGSEIEGDMYESNDTQDAAYQLGSIKDDTEFPAGTVTASLWSEGDTDWYTYFDEDNALNLAFFIPTVSLSAPPGTDYRVCTFFTCENGEEPDITNCEGGVEWDVEAGLYGCCASGSTELTIKMSVQCTFQGLQADSGDVHVRVDNLDNDWSCGDYTLNWGDD